jgi:hypothetical protein
LPVDAPVDKQPTSTPQQQPAYRTYRLALAALLLVCALLYLPGLTRPAGYYHDDAIYMLTGRALALGHGYRIESLPGTPLQTKYPPLYPALLAVLWHLAPQFPRCVVAFRLANIACWLAALALTYDLLVRFRYASPPMALLVVALRGLSLDAAHTTELVITECLSTLLVTGCLWAAEYALAEGRTEGSIQRTALACGLLLGLAVLTHASVALLWVALIMALGLKRRATVGPMSLAAFPECAGWALWTRQASHLPGWDLRDYYIDYLGWAVHQVRIIPLPVLIAANLEHLLVFGIPAHVLPFETDARIVAALPHGFTWFHALVGLGIMGLIFTGSWTLARERRPLLPLATVALSLPACLWPADGGRYTFPAGALCLFLALRGGQALLSAFPRLRAPLLIGGIAVTLISAAMTCVAYTHSLANPAPAGATSAVEDWVRHNVAPDEAICARDDARIFLTTDRRGISDRAWMGLTWHGLTVEWHDRPGYCPDARRQRDLLRALGVRWFIDAGRPGRSHGWGTPTLLNAHPEWFEPVNTGNESDFRVYRWREPVPLRR